MKVNKQANNKNENENALSKQKVMKNREKVEKTVNGAILEQQNVKEGMKSDKKRQSKTRKNGDENFFFPFRFCHSPLSVVHTIQCGTVNTHEMRVTNKRTNLMEDVNQHFYSRIQIDARTRVKSAQSSLFISRQYHHHFFIFLSFPFFRFFFFYLAALWVLHLLPSAKQKHTYTYIYAILLRK